MEQAILHQKLKNSGEIDFYLQNRSPYNPNVTRRNETVDSNISNIPLNKRDVLKIDTINMIEIFVSFYSEEDSSETLFRAVANKLKKANLKLTIKCRPNLILFKIPFDRLNGKDFGYPDKKIKIVMMAK